MSDNNSLSHTTWNCKYHIVFAPKYRRKAFYGSNRAEIGAILRELCKWKGVNIINAEVCPNHIHNRKSHHYTLRLNQALGSLPERLSLSRRNQ